MDLDTLLSIVLTAGHLLGFAVLIGALLHVRYFVATALTDDEAGAREFQSFSAKGARWIHAAIALSLVTGLAQYAIRAQLIRHPLVGTKILIALAGFAFASMVFRSRGEARSLATVRKHATIGLLLFVATLILGVIATK